MNVAVILAGGVGNRLDKSYPKQFFKVAGKTVIEHTVDVFERNQLIDEIAIVINSNYQVTIEEIVLANNWKKVRKILNGGAERHHSSMAAVNAYADEGNINLIFHDAVRPLLSERIINETVAALEKYNAVDVAIPAVDTIISTDNDFIDAIPDRSKLRRGQTPQGFKLNTIKEAYKYALKDPTFKSTDDCGVVLRYLPDEKIFVVKGEEVNMKLTYKEDSYLLDKLFQLRSFAFYDQNISFDQLKDKVLVVFGGSSGIGADVARIARQHGARVHSFSRSLNQVDITSVESVRQSLELVATEEKKIDYIVNTAALLLKEPLNSMDYKSVCEMVQINYMGMINVAMESFKYLKDSQGQLLFYTSSSYTRGRAFYSIYSSTKAAVVNFVQAIAQEWENAAIRVNCINPERTKTPMRVKNFGIEDDATLLKPEDVARESIKTLLSDFTGQVVDVKLSNK